MLDIELQTISSGYDRKTCWVKNQKQGATERAHLLPESVSKTEAVRRQADKRWRAGPDA